MAHAVLPLFHFPCQLQGAYDDAEGWQALAAALDAREAAHVCCPAGRLYYLALPPSVYPEV